MFLGKKKRKGSYICSRNRKERTTPGKGSYESCSFKMMDKRLGQKRVRSQHVPFGTDIIWCSKND
jgi:hypothetical protein